MGPFDSHGTDPGLFHLLLVVVVASAAWLFRKGREHARGKRAPESAAPSVAPHRSAAPVLLVAAVAVLVVVLFALPGRRSSGRPEPLKPRPVVVDPSSASTVKESLDRAAALIRRSAPMFAEISDGVEAGGPADLKKVERLRENLQEARGLYSDVRGAAPDPALVESRIRKIDTLLERTSGWLEQSNPPSPATTTK